MNLHVFTPPYRGFLKAIRRELATISTEPPVILCVGSDRLTGDALGPLVGSFLTKDYNVPTYVYGTLARTVTALNLKETLTFIAQTHAGRKLLIIDASLGTSAEIGEIRLTRGGICPGAASGKKLGKIGDLAITAVVNALPDRTLATTKLGFVHDLAGVIALSIAAGLSTQPIANAATVPLITSVV